MTSRKRKSGAGWQPTRDTELEADSNCFQRGSRFSIEGDLPQAEGALGDIHGRKDYFT